jgi:hypothetical protein
MSEDTGMWQYLDLNPTLSLGVIPNPRTFTSGARDLARTPETPRARSLRLATLAQDDRHGRTIVRMQIETLR